MTKRSGGSRLGAVNFLNHLFGELGTDLGLHEAQIVDFERHLSEFPELVPKKLDVTDLYAAFVK